MLGLTVAAPQRYAASLQRFYAAVLAGEQHLEVYSQNYLGAHVRALENTYPVTLELLGSATFSALAQVYVQHYPPQAWDLNVYGEDFDGLLQAQEQGGRAAEYNWRGVAATARIEFALTRAYYAADGPDPVAIHIPPDPQAQLDACAIGARLQQQHPFADIQQPLRLSGPVSIRRQGVRIRVDNQAPADVSPRCGTL